MYASGSKLAASYILGAAGEDYLPRKEPGMVKNPGAFEPMK